ncbi:MAG: YfcE family phosphodiesterase [Phycisphaerales bacterium]|nr:YfcE family phosphodiesterase [Phycisphaerales bacterium]
MTDPEHARAVPPAAIGLLSDSHGNVDRTRRGVDLLLEEGADLLVHLGDVGSRLVLDQLVGLPARVVFGNCDDDQDLAAYAAAQGIAVDHPGATLPTEAGLLAITHGHLEGVIRGLIDEEPRYLAHGHSHEVRDETLQGVRFLNPGALQRARRYTVALLRPAEDQFTVFEVTRAGLAR